MNDTLAILAPTVNVPPSSSPIKARPWWVVRRPLALMLALLTGLWLVTVFQRVHLDRWLVLDLPDNVLSAAQSGGQ